MKKLRRKKAHGIDQLPPNLLKDVPNEISKPLAFIIKKSLLLGIVPDLWKVTSLYKSDSKSDFSNYSPISVLPCLSKVLEQVVHRQLSKSLLTGIIYLDLSKAFDAVSHWYLLSKIPFYGISGNEFTWLENYLFNRKEHVFYDGNLSKAFRVFRGIPQGSIFGPTLFLLHLDDIDDWLGHSSIIKYAEDTVIYFSGNNSESIQKKTKSGYSWSSQLANRHWPFFKLEKG